MTLRSTFLGLAAAGLAAFAQPAAAKCALQKAIEIPITMVGLRPTIPAKIDGADVRLFIDTGSPLNTLNPGTAARIGLRTAALPPYIQFRGVTGEADMRWATARDFTIMGLPFHGAQFLVGEHALGGGDGLIGEDMLAKADVEYDLANGVVRLFVAKDCGSANLAYWSDGAASFVPIESIGPQGIQHIIGSASVNGEKIRVMFDTGTPRSSLTLSAAKRAGVRTDAAGVVSAEMISGLGARVIPTWLAPFNSFEIGGETVKGTKLRIADFDIGEADMLLGTDFFLSHRILVSHSQNRLYFTYNGGPVFNLEQGVAAASASPAAPTPNFTDAPKTADDFARLGASEAARHEYDQAIADYTQAIALAPTDPANFYQRGMTRVMNAQPIVAMSDFDQALKLKPDDVPALMMRGDLRLISKDEAGAQADFAAAIKADPEVTVRVGDAYARVGRYDTAILNFDSWIAAHRRNEDSASVLADRCRARAMLGIELDKALADCNAALGYRPGASEYLAARGLVKLRLGQLDPAISDFNAALRLEPKAPWALYGRGVAEAHKGEADKSAADLAAATAAAPHLAAQAAKAGIKP